jgi:hypothetical protein
MYIRGKTAKRRRRSSAISIPRGYCLLEFARGASDDRKNARNDVRDDHPRKLLLHDLRGWIVGSIKHRLSTLGCASLGRIFTQSLRHRPSPLSPFSAPTMVAELQAHVQMEVYTMRLAMSLLL